MDLDQTSANVFVRDDAFGAQLRAHLVEAMEEGLGRRVGHAEHQRRPYAARALTWIAYALMRVALLITGKRY